MIYKNLKAIGLAMLGTALLMLPGVVSAEDLLVVCARDGNCSISLDSKPLFDEDDLKPGDTHTQNFEVRNERDEACTLTFAVDETKQDPNDFAQRLFTVIKEGSHNWYGAGGSDTATDDKNLDNLYGADPIDLGNIESNETRNFKWIVTFDRDAGNEYQRAETKFDFDLNFECESLPRISGIVSGTLGKILGDKLTRFPSAGDQSSASIRQRNNRLSRLLALSFAIILGSYLILKISRKKWARNE